MANGYVQNMNPLFRQPFHQRFPTPRRPAPPPSNDPSALFAQNNAQCAFPNAFPADGPNIMQRFWIRLFMTLIYGPYTFLRSRIEMFYTTILALYIGDMETQILIESLHHNSWSIIIGLVVVLVACVGAYFFSPKGETNTYVPHLGADTSSRLITSRIWRWTLILSFASCYIMWGMIEECPPRLITDTDINNSNYLSSTMASPHRATADEAEGGIPGRKLIWSYRF
jgi:hypothetical protein